MQTIQMKYFLIILSLALSTGTIAQTTKRSVETAKPETTDPNGIDPGITPTPAPPPPPIVFTFVEQMPSPSVDISSYISKNIHYPDSAQKNGTQGTVAVSFIVNEDGTLSNVRAVRGIGSGCDEEAVRVIKSMPPWKPGKQNGKNVKVNYTQPVRFFMH